MPSAYYHRARAASSEAGRKENQVNALKKSDFNFDLPPELIAQTPLERRDASRLLCLDKNSGEMEHRHFYQLPELLREGPDVWNKVFRRSLFTDNSIRFTPRVWFEDLRTIPKLYAFTDRILYIPRALHRYVQRPGSVTNTQKVQRNLEIIPAVEELIDFYKGQGRYEQLKDVLEYLAFHCVFLTSSVRANLADWKSPVQEELMQDFLGKFPGYRDNPYVKSLSRQHTLLDHLLRRRMRLCVHILMKLNNWIKDKKL